MILAAVMSLVLQQAPEPQKNLRTATYLTLGVGVAAAAASLAVGFGLALGRADAYAHEEARVNALPAEQQNAVDLSYLADLKAERDGVTAASIGLGVGGGVMLVTSLILFLATKRGPDNVPIALAAFAPKKNGANLGVVFTF